MSTNTSIQWTDYTWSPWLGCRKVSPGCENCYITTTTPFRTRKIEHGSQRGTLSKGYWDQAVRWNKRALAQMIKAQVTGGRYRNPRVFPSLCDPFDPEVSIELFNAFMVLVDKTPNLTWLLLTKRPQWVMSRWKQVIRHWGRQSEDLPDNVWLGVSVEDQKRADERIPILLSIPAKVRFLSVEPMLGPVNLTPYINQGIHSIRCEKCAGPGMNGGEPCKCQWIDWVIFGGESGHGARRCQLDWIRDGLAQCRAAGVAPFIKQLGSNAHRHGGEDESETRLALKHPKGGEINQFPTDLRVREFPQLHDACEAARPCL